MEKDICIARKVDVNLGKGFQKFDIWHNANGTLELVPFNRKGDAEEFSEVLIYNEQKGSYQLVSKQLNDEEEE